MLKSPVSFASIFVLIKGKIFPICQHFKKMPYVFVVSNRKLNYRTWRGYKTDITRYIIPYFQHKDIRHIKSKDIRLFKEHLEKTVATKTVYNKMSTLKTMFRDAHRDEDIRRVPPFPTLSAGQIGRPESLAVEKQDCIISAIPAGHRLSL
jgi:hypothetical protein